MINQYEIIWNNLNSESIMQDQLLARVAIKDLDKRVCCAIDFLKKRHIIIKLEKTEKACFDNKSRGILIETKNLIVNNEQIRAIDIICNDPAGYKQFDLLLDDIIISLKEIKKQPCEVVKTQIIKWRKFWTNPINTILGKEKIVGLFAELFFLNEYMLNDLSTAVAISGWKGPYGSNHDYYLKSATVEIKSTISNEGNIHHINGIEQLEQYKEQPLFLYSLHLKDDPFGTSLPAIIEKILVKIQEDINVVDKFENALASAGYLNQHEHEYSDFLLNPVRERLFLVDDKFPKILKSSFKHIIPAGINDIEYTINLQNAQESIKANSTENIRLLLKNYYI